MGSGGMIVIAEGTCMVRLLQVMLRFYHHESCGQCTPCREGMGWMHRIIDRIVAGEGRAEDIERLYQISAWNDGTTICGMGDAAGYATSGILDKFRDEFEYWIEHKRSRFDGTWNARNLHKRTVDPGRARPDRHAGGAGATASTSRISAGTRSSPSPATAASAACRSKGRSWVEIACNMPVTEGLRVLTDSDAVKEYRKSIMQLMTLNHPVDCGICDKAGECTLQDYHYKYNGAPSVVASTRRSARPSSIRSPSASCSTTSAASSARAACASRARSRSRTRSASSQRGDTSLVRAAEDRSARRRPVFRQHRRPLPGRRAAVAPVPVQGARLVPQADAVRLPGLRARLHRADLAPQARMEAQRARPAAERRGSSA